MRLLKVGWKVASLSAQIASVRYRALLPMLALERAGVESRLFSRFSDECLNGLDVLVIVKSLTSDDILLAQRAAEKNIRVIFDLCDNVFVDGYLLGGSGNPAHIFCAISSYANAIVTTTEPLANVVRELAPTVHVEIIPDGVENSLTVVKSEELIRSASRAESSGKSFESLLKKIKADADRLHREGLRCLPSVGKSYARGAIAISKSTARLAIHRFLPKFPAKETLPKTDKDTLYILWFGNHGAPYARFGILDLLEFREALEAVAGEFKVELVVISNNQKKFEEYIRPFAIPSRYVEWSPSAVERWLQLATVVIVPNTLDPFSLCKSANRTVLAVTSGVPVVATPTPALQPLAAHLHLGKPLEGLRRYLSDPTAGKREAELAAQLAQQIFGPETLGRSWRALLDQLLPQSARMVSKPPQVLVVLHLIQDLDLAIPILNALQGRKIEAEAWCSVSLITQSPRVLATLRRHGFLFRVLHEDDYKTVQFASRTRALLTISETNLSPHQFGRALSERAIEQGLYVTTLQHGFENVGLTYSDSVHPIEKISFIAQRIYTWGPLGTLHAHIPPDIKARCFPVGCPKPVFCETADLLALINPEQSVIGIFENLHWHRYERRYSKAFLEGVVELAETFPEVYFLVKPHHAGLWLTHRHKGNRPVVPNVIIADPKSKEWEQHTATALLGRMTAVITTPSTVAVDAARQRLPVAVFADTMELSNYHPLPLLRQHDEWTHFVTQALDPVQRGRLELASVAFVNRVLVPGDAADHIANDLASALNDSIEDRTNTKTTSPSGGL